MLKVKYVKHNTIRFNSVSNREKGIMMFVEFFDSIVKVETGKEMRGHMILVSMSDPNGSIVLTFWETKEDMSRFYSRENKRLANLVERAMPLFEKLPERADYAVTELFMTQ